MVDSIILDKKRILPCSVYLNGEYGISDVFVSVPVKLGKNGVEQIIEIKLTPEEDAALRMSARAVKERIEVTCKLPKLTFLPVKRNIPVSIKEESE